MIPFLTAKNDFCYGILHLLERLETIVLVKAGCDVGMDDRLCLFFGQVLADLTDVVEVVPCYLCIHYKIPKRFLECVVCVPYGIFGSSYLCVRYGILAFFFNLLCLIAIYILFSWRSVFMQ